MTKHITITLTEDQAQTLDNALHTTLAYHADGMVEAEKHFARRLIQRLHKELAKAKTV